MTIEKRYENILNKINIASEKREVNQNSEVMLLGVTKNIKVDVIQEAIDLGLKNLGENKVQEFLNKHDKIEGNVNWHFIGHLQRNKVKYIIDKVVMIHSVDSIRLAEEIDKRAFKIKKKMDILIEINICDEKNKSGIRFDEIENFINEIEKFKNINIKGLMIIPPKGKKTTFLKEIFQKVYKKKIDINATKRDNRVSYLSMGMSSDYEIAIECGADIVRIGQSLFKRDNIT